MTSVSGMSRRAWRQCVSVINANEILSGLLFGAGWVYKTKIISKHSKDLWSLWNRYMKWTYKTDPLDMQMTCCWGCSLVQAECVYITSSRLGVYICKIDYYTTSVLSIHESSHVAGSACRSWKQRNSQINKLAGWLYIYTNQISRLD